MNVSLYNKISTHMMSGYLIKIHEDHVNPLTLHWGVGVPLQLHWKGVAPQAHRIE